MRGASPPRASSRAPAAGQLDPWPTFNVALLGNPESGRSRLFGSLLSASGAEDKWAPSQFLFGRGRQGHEGRTELHCGTMAVGSRRLVLFDLPRHREHAETALCSLAQAHVIILVVSAKHGESEPTSQSKELAVLMKASAAEKVIVAITKMDDPEVQWAPERFVQVQTGVRSMLRSMRLPEAVFVPVSGATHGNVLEGRGGAPWYRGRTLVQCLEAWEPTRRPGPPLFLPLSSRPAEGGLEVAGTVLQGVLEPGLRCTLAPPRRDCVVEALASANGAGSASAGEFATLTLSGAASCHPSRGDILWSEEPVRCVSKFKAMLQVLPSAAGTPISPGFTARMFAHVAARDCQLVRIFEVVDLVTKESQVNLSVVQPNTLVRCEISLSASMPLATFADDDILGGFVLQKESQIVARGKVTQLPTAHARGCAARPGVG